MTSYIRSDLRQLVRSRANQLCEYCLMHIEDSYFGCQVDHVISEKQGGPTDAANLAYACAFCNRAKGSDIGSVVQSTGAFTRLFHPRTDRWSDHFELNGMVIDSRTPIGEATVRLLRFHSPDRLLERQALADIGRYPHPGALEHMAAEDA